ADKAVEYLKQSVRKSWLPNLLNKMGDYMEPAKDLQEALNFDFRRRPSFLQAVAKLHTGSIVIDKAVILILVAEAY
ncbi:uncharacterized protein BYT42DRAFT_485886, partial [Radiomyces spectabilis]|uniref:uncharacterized protein n=1 Tax=Radiomyces spectabilis TaxID=64574 RepID=UPI00221F1CA2